MAKEESDTRRPEQWQAPDCEQIRVSAEATAYMGVTQDLL